MGKNVNYKQFEQFKKKLEKTLNDDSRQKFMEDCTKELAARLLARVIKLSPTKTSALKKQWSIDNKIINVEKVGEEYHCTIFNSIDYGSYVNYGHRIMDKDKNPIGWVPGQHFLAISENEVNALAPALLEKRLMEYLKNALE